MSTNSPFGTTYGVQSGQQMVTGVGGQVAGKVTIVVLQFTQQIMQ